MGMTVSCQNCDELRTDLQAIIGLASKLRYRLLKGGACNTDGVVSASEQCDALADPTGCPVTSIPMFCDDQCLCEAIICSTGQTNCSGVCVDLTTDPDNCGSCGTVCPSTAPACVGSMCTIP